jgi:hypothetical protein
MYVYLLRVPRVGLLVLGLMLSTAAVLAPSGRRFSFLNSGKLDDPGETRIKHHLPDCIYAL